MQREGVIIVGAGAAGLATAIFARRINPAVPVRLVDGAARPGAKILVSGGSRCNVTNAVVTEHDYWGGKRTIIKRVLSRLPVIRTVAFFEELGVRLKQEPTGKLFPVSDRSRDVLDALMHAARALDVTMLPGTRVLDVRRAGDGFELDTAKGTMYAEAVVMATGGLSLPRTGSDGAGLTIAQRLGHTIVPTTPALAPLVLGGGSMHERLSGVAHEVELALTVGGRVVERLRGPMLWTHFGISGPAPLDASRHWLRARLDDLGGRLSVSLRPGESFEQIDAQLATVSRTHPRATLQSVLAEMLPNSVTAALLDHLQLAAAQHLADVTREARRAVVHALTALPLDVTDSRGYNHAEATAGGVTLTEIDPATMQSRTCRGLFLVGEMLDVDGRLGGFNFQWAWSSGRAAAEGLARFSGVGRSAAD